MTLDDVKFLTYCDCIAGRGRQTNDCRTTGVVLCRPADNRHFSIHWTEGKKKSNKTSAWAEIKRRDETLTSMVWVIVKRVNARYDSTQYIKNGNSNDLAIPAIAYWREGGVDHSHFTFKAQHLTTEHFIFITFSLVPLCPQNTAKNLSSPAGHPNGSFLWGIWRSCRATLLLCRIHRGRMFCRGLVKGTVHHCLVWPREIDLH